MLALFVNVPPYSPATFRLRKIRTPFADPKYSADHVPLPHIFTGRVIQ